MSDVLTETIIWVPVAERLPSHGGYVFALINDSEYPWLVKFVENQWVSAWSLKPLSKSERVACWAEMPKGPSVVP